MTKPHITHHDVFVSSVVLTILASTAASAQTRRRPDGMVARLDARRRGRSRWEFRREPVRRTSAAIVSGPGTSVADFDLRWRPLGPTAFSAFAALQVDPLCGSDNTVPCEMSSSVRVSLYRSPDTT